MSRLIWSIYWLRVAAMVLAIAATLATAYAADWPTYGFSSLRTGNNPNERTLGTQSVNRLRPLWRFTTRGPVTAQPVFAQAVPVNGKPVDMLFVGDNGGYFYALRASDGGVVWSRQLGSRTVAGCDDLPGGVFGIVASAVIRRAASGGRGVVYIAANGKLYGFDLSTGTPVWPSPNGDGAVAVPAPVPGKDDYVYGGLNFANGTLYLATALACEGLPAHGQIATFSTAGKLVHQWFTVGGASSAKNPDGGGIWGPGGVSVDPSLNGGVFAATGNAFPEGHPQESAPYAEDIVRLNSGITVLLADSAPSFTDEDADFGATPLLFQPTGCQRMLAAVAKSGQLFVYSNRDTLRTPQIVQVSVQPFLVGIPAWDPNTQRVFLTNPADSRGGLYKRGLLAFDARNCQLNLVWQTANMANRPLFANGTYLSPPTVANGVVYFGTGASYHGAGSTPPNVYAVSASNGQLLWQSNNISGPVLTAPTVVNGKVFVGSFDNHIYAYGL